MVKGVPNPYFQRLITALEEALRVSPVQITDTRAFAYALVDGIEIARLKPSHADEYAAFEFALAYALSTEIPTISRALLRSESASITHTLVRILSGADTNTVQTLAACARAGSGLQVSANVHSGPLNSAKKAYALARLNEVIGLLDGDPTFDATALRARALLRLEQPANALDQLMRLKIEEVRATERDLRRHFRQRSTVSLEYWHIAPRTPAA